MNTKSSVPPDQNLPKRSRGRPRKERPADVPSEILRSALLASLLVPLDEMAASLGISNDAVLAAAERKVVCSDIDGKEQILVDPAEIYTRLQQSQIEVEIDSIKLLPECQVRAALRDDVVEDYRVHFAEDGPGMAPVTITQVEGELQLVDGFHRIEAAKREGRTRIAARVFPGTSKIAVLAARKLNFFHGIQLSSADLRRSLLSAVHESAELRKALINKSPSLRKLSNLTGFSKSALHSVAAKIRKSGLDEQGELALADGDPATDSAPPFQSVPLKSHPEALALLLLLRTKVGSLPSSPGDITTSHLPDLAQVAGIGLRLMALHLGRDGFARAAEVKSQLRLHPLPTS